MRYAVFEEVDESRFVNWLLVPLPDSPHEKVQLAQDLPIALADHFAEDIRHQGFSLH